MQINLLQCIRESSSKGGGRIIRQRKKSMLIALNAAKGYSSRAVFSWDSRIAGIYSPEATGSGWP